MFIGHQLEHGIPSRGRWMPAGEKRRDGMGSWDQTLRVRRLHLGNPQTGHATACRFGFDAESSITARVRNANADRIQTTVAHRGIRQKLWPTELVVLSGCGRETSEVACWRSHSLSEGSEVAATDMGTPTMLSQAFERRRRGRGRWLLSNERTWAGSEGSLGRPSIISESGHWRES